MTLFFIYNGFVLQIKQLASFKQKMLKKKKKKRSIIKILVNTFPFTFLIKDTKNEGVIFLDQTTFRSYN